MIASMKKQGPMLMETGEKGKEEGARSVLRKNLY